MAYNLAPLQNLIEQFERMQGIGHKTAQRMAFYVLDLSDEDAKRFAQAITDAHTKNQNISYQREIVQHSVRHKAGQHYRKSRHGTLQHCHRNK